MRNCEILRGLKDVSFSEIKTHTFYLDISHIKHNNAEDNKKLKFCNKKKVDFRLCSIDPSITRLMQANQSCESLISSNMK